MKTSDIDKTTQLDKEIVQVCDVFENHRNSKSDCTLFQTSKDLKNNETQDFSNEPSTKSSIPVDRHEANNLRKITFNSTNSFKSEPNDDGKKPRKKSKYLGIRRNALVENEKKKLNRSTSTNLSSTKKPVKCECKKEPLKKQIKAAKQLGILLGAFLIAWLPYFVIFTVVAFCNNCIPDSIYTASVWLGYLNSSINPILYSLCNTGFENAIRAMLSLKRPMAHTRRDFIEILKYTSGNATDTDVN